MSRRKSREMLGPLHTHKCALCGHSWECMETVKADGECEAEVEKAAKANGIGPFCNLHLHLEMARRYAELRGLVLTATTYPAPEPAGAQVRGLQP